MWHILILVHLTGLVGYNLLLRKSVAAKIDKVVLAAVMQTGIAVPAVILMVLHPTEFGTFLPRDFAYLAAAVLLTLGLQVTNVKALQYLEAGVFSVLYNVRLVLTTALGILFLHEPVVGLRILGGLCILLAIIIVKQRGSHVVRAKGMEWGIAAALCVSFLNLTEKSLINDIQFINYFPLMSVISAVLLWLYVLGSKRPFNRQLLIRRDMLQLMTARAASAYGFSGALAAGALISVANYISGISVIIIVLLGAAWLGERDYLGRKLAAAGVAMVGLTIIFLSSL